MDRLRVRAHRFRHPLGGAARRRGEHDLQPARAVDLHERADDRRLADAGPARDDRELRAEAARERGRLLVGEREARPLLPPRDGARGVNRREGRRRAQDALDVRRDLLLRPPVGFEVNPSRALALARALRDHAAVSDLAFERRAENLRRDFRQLVGVQQQLVFERPAVPAVLRLRLERVGD